MASKQDLTIAERIADMYHNDGAEWWRGSRHLETVCHRFCKYASTLRRPVARPYGMGGTTRFDFPDGSAIITSGSCWDLGFDRSGCACMMGAGHDDLCETLAPSVASVRWEPSGAGKVKWSTLTGPVDDD